MHYPTLRSFIAMLFCVVMIQVEAQILFVNDNDNITYNTDTILNDLLAAGFAVDVYDVAAEGIAPGADVLSSYPTTIWYCSGDGLGLGLWDSEADLQDYVEDGGALWLIGTDMLYAQYGGVPYTFESGELPFDLMGITSYDVQSYGNDDGEGCPQMDSDLPAFEPTLTWVFSTFWWADGVTPMTSTQVIYAMGPEGYALQGAASMVHHHTNGQNVMSTFFDPALIGTFEARVLFLQQTLDHMASHTGVVSPSRTDELQLVPVEGAGFFLLTTQPTVDISLRSMAGQVVLDLSAVQADRTLVDTRSLCPGMYVVTATMRDGTRRSAKWMAR